MSGKSVKKARIESSKVALVAEQALSMPLAMLYYTLTSIEAMS